MWTFEPILKSVIWGGDKIVSYKGITSKEGSIGESWEISGVEGAESVVASGPDKGLSMSELLKRYGADLLGEKNFIKYGNRFPLLIKFIDARTDLSVQVHPSDELALKRGFPSGKNEMWYIIGAEREAYIANGFNRDINPDDYQNLISSGEVLNTLNNQEIKRGDAFYIPAGRVHAIGKGTFLAEIQQASDITYRLYDYKRKDKNGNERELHISQAFEAINFEKTDSSPILFIPLKDLPVNLVTSPSFTTNIWRLENEIMRDYSEWDTFVIVTCTSGSANLSSGNETINLREGHCVLIPASCSNLLITPTPCFEALETYIK